MSRRAYGLAVTLAVAMAALAILTAELKGLPVRDPDGFLGPSWVRLPLIVLAGFLFDVLPRGLFRARGRHGLWQHMRAVVRERWTRDRVAMVVAGVGSFYLTYVSYRNLKSYLPWMRYDDYADEQLAELDRLLAFGYNPSDVLHGLLGTGISAHILSFAYVAYLLFVPVTMCAWLVWSRNVAGGLWYATMLCLNWAFGLASYYMIPSLGPVFHDPSHFWDLPHTGVSDLQTALWDSKYWVILDPVSTQSVSSIAGFASLHVSVVFAAALITHMTVRSGLIRGFMWTYLGLTMLATIYFGWHYILDDVAGLVIGWITVWLAAWATGHRMSTTYRGQLFGGGKPKFEPAEQADEVPQPREAPDLESIPEEAEQAPARAAVHHSE